MLESCFLNMHVSDLAIIGNLVSFPKFPSYMKKEEVVIKEMRDGGEGWSFSRTSDQYCGFFVFILLKTISTK